MPRTIRVVGVPGWDFPRGITGDHLGWYFATRERGVATVEEIDAHFAPEYRWGWGSPRDPAALEVWFSRWRTLTARIEGIEVLSPLEFLVTTRLDSGVVARVWFEMESEPPHRIRRTRTTEQNPDDGPVDFGETSTFIDGSSTVPAAFTTAVGPFGGYVAALALRGAGATSSKAWPLRLSGHFVSVGRSGPVESAVDVLRASSRLESSKVELRQGENLLFSGHVWSAAPTDGSRAHVALPRALTDAVAAGAPGDGGGQPSLGGALESAWRSIDGFDASAWVRVRPRGVFGDGWTDAARLLLPIDWLGVAAGVTPHRDEGGMVVASTLEISASFFGHERHTEWVLCAAMAPASNGPWASTGVTVLSADGAVLALATLQLLLRG